MRKKHLIRLSFPRLGFHVNSYKNNICGEKTPCIIFIKVILLKELTATKYKKETYEGCSEIIKTTRFFLFIIEEFCSKLA